MKSQNWTHGHQEPSWPSLNTTGHRGQFLDAEGEVWKCGLHERHTNGREMAADPAHPLPWLFPSKKKCLDHARESDEHAVYLLGSQVLIQGGIEVMVGAGDTAWGSTGNRWESSLPVSSPGRVF